MSESSKVTVNYFCIGAFLIFIGCVLICCLGFIIVLPFETTRQWPLVHCKVVNSSYSAHFCSCDEGFSENYATEFEEETGFSIADKVNKSGLRSENQHIYLTPQNPKFRNVLHPLPHLMCQSKYPCLQIYVQYEIETISKAKPSQNLIIDFNSQSMIERESDNETMAMGKEILSYEQVLNLSNSNELNPINRSNASVLEQSEEKNVIGEDKNVKPEEGQIVKMVRTQVAMLYRSWDDSFYSKCSLTECGDDVWNLKENRRFKREWGKPEEIFKCYYNPNKPNITIIDKTPASAVLHAILWPVLCLLAGTSLWICLCCGCCKAGDKDSTCKEKYKIVA